MKLFFVLAALLATLASAYVSPRTGGLTTFAPLQTARALRPRRGLATRMAFDDDEGDGSRSGRRLSSDRLQRMADNEEGWEISGEGTADNTIVYVLTGVFVASIVGGLIAAQQMGFDGTPRV
mmetsp:Transcript_1770/g.2742  ORF Transcript_1770/g.2742 Transcript_1770/m.2742 type:complete len:122 (+) Transcript_1770:69-434(+)|eukprot:CAMPEP_0205924794 /NCGR_PEP_ID=MMETSP1325-20131115/17180_1 /ASSEMBLY_ACC=CAM_ASM_000708 /TAXON_ID=236786 /ORGANISM="Florenciella sp., Strain RCC1007" /LENGTH=121 /DNA_ID=CAMNT_0053293207 /DNA_START=69 /DNA_END=434 /DNA_ORIENTATION=+